MLRNFKLTLDRKIYGIIGMCFIGLIGMLVFDLVEQDRALREQRQHELQHLGQIALSILKEEYEEVSKGLNTEAEAKQRALEHISTMRYGQGDYFWINDMNRRVIMHPVKPELNGKDVSDMKDPNGKRLFSEFVEVVKRNGSGFVDYDWPKPGTDKPQPKLSYVVGFEPWGWVIGTGVYVDDLKQQVWNASKRQVILATGLLLIIGAIATYVTRRMSKAMKGMTSAMHELAQGRFDVVLPGLGRRDEIGEIALAVESFKLKAAEKARQEALAQQHEREREAEAQRDLAAREAAEKKAAEEKATAERKAAMHKLAGEFERAVGNIVNTVTSTSAELEAAAQTLSNTADTTLHLSSTVAAASETASANVQSVASATDEMTSSLNEISRQVQESSRIAGEAVKQAGKTDTRITELSQAASRIGDVVNLITAIAEQTNLLALNATIEAARAGEAGKGFAVVAQEVKALAAQTAKATDEISKQISSMQTATHDSVAAIKEIGGTIGRISDIASSIAIAVEQQGMATQEIARNIHHAAQGTGEVADNITEVNRGAGETGSSAAQVLCSAKALATESGHLKLEVAKFLDTVRAA